MNKEERLNAALAYLLAHGVVKTKKEFAARLGMAVGTVSRALHGNEASLTDNLMLNVYRVFRPVFNYDWIMSGDGAMLDHSLPEPGCVGPAPRLSPENARLVYRKQPPVDVDVADDELSSRCNNCTNSDDGMAHEDLASASHDGDGDDAEQSQADIDRDWEEKAQPILGEQSQDKLQAELDRIRKIRTDTDKANREAHAMLTELAAVRSSIETARAGLLSTTNDLLTALATTRQLIADLAAIRPSVTANSPATIADDKQHTDASDATCTDGNK